MVTAFPEIGEPDLELPRAGSAAWYALLFTPDDRRVGVAAAMACRREIAGTVRRGVDDGVARVRLAWWREETVLLRSGRPRHPATRHLAAAVEDPAGTAECLAAMLGAAERDLARAAFPDLASLLAHCADDGGAFYELVARSCGHGSPSAPAATALRDLGAGGCLVGLIRRLHQDAVDGRCYLPRALGFPTDACRTASLGSDVREALATTAREARASMRRAIEGLPARERSPCATPLVLAALQARLLRRLERRDFAVIGHWTELTGMSKLLTAWTAARRSIRGRTPRLVGIDL
jgi:phytoene synthase